MKPRRSFWSAALFLSLIAPSAQAAGFERATVAAAQPIDIGIWYPSDDPPPDEFNTRFRQAVAIGGEPTGEGLPLVVLSHGYGGWMGGHADTALALAEAGFVAVAPTHPGTNYKDKSAPPSEWMVSRPRHISSVIDFMLEEWGHSRRLAPGQIGVFGFSAGGYTALVAAGATPDIALAIEHCAGNPAEFLCRIGVIDEVAASSLRTSDAAFSSDPRIRAISVAAPGLGFAFGRDGLADLSVPVQIWSGSLDDRVPHETNVAPLVQWLPGPAEVHVVDQAGHFAFLTPCNPATEDANPRIWNRICVDTPGFDRTAFHDIMNAGIIAFFDRTLKN